MNGSFQPVKSAFEVVKLLKTCAFLKDLSKGSKLHAYIREHTFLKNNSFVGSTLVNMYAKCGALTMAQQVLKELHGPDAVAWSTLIAGYAQQGQGEEALQCFDSMLHEGHPPDSITFTCVLQACGSMGAAAKGEQIHSEIDFLGMLEKDIVLGSILVDMYARCGTLARAKQVLEGLPVRDVVMWSILIAGYTHQGQAEEALKCFGNMQQEGHSPDAVTFTCTLKACSSIGAAVKGKQIHDMIVSLGMLEKDIVLGTALVDMYARCGELSKAQQVLEGLPIRDMITWNALIAGYVQQGQGDEALECYDSMQREGHSPNAVTYSCVLKVCGNIGVAAKGEQIHYKIHSLGMLKDNIMLGSVLVDMYARCGILAKAEQVFEALSVRDLVTWRALIAGYVQQGQGEAALECFDRMLSEGCSPDADTFAYALKACGSIRAAAKGTLLHDIIVELVSLEKNIMLGSNLVDMYSNCGELVKALQVLEGLPVRDMVTWSTLLAGYAHWGQGEEVLKCFETMQHEGHSPDAITFTYALKACGIIGAAANGGQIHEKIVSLALLDKNIELASSLVNMYARCSALSKAQEVLEALPVRNLVTWNALIAGYVHQDKGEEALKCYDSMQHEGHFPNSVTFVCALKACANIGAITKGEQIHDKIISLGIPEKDIVLGSILVHMYVKCGALTKAQEVLEGLHIRDVVTWSALIAGYVQQGHGEEALECFNNMQCEGFSPNDITFMSALKACGIQGDVMKGEQIHDRILCLGMLEKVIVLGNNLVDMYARCGALAKAQQVLEELPVRDVVTWSTLSTGYVQQGQGEKALRCYDNMQCEGHFSDLVAFICALKACGIIGAAAKGKQIHEKIVKVGMLAKSMELGNALVDMYVKCAAVTKALEVFRDLPFQNVVTWNSLIGGYAQQGRSFEELNCLEKMQSKGLKPDSITFTCVLNGCSNSGLLDEAEVVFLIMAIRYGVRPDVEHCCCMVDLFGHAMEFNKALAVIEKMPSSACHEVWVTLLGACNKWEQVKIGRLAFEHALQLDKSNASIYVSMGSIYVAAGMQENANKK